MDIFPDVPNGLHAAETTLAGGVVVVDRMPVVWQRNDVEPDDTLKDAMGDVAFARLRTLVETLWTTLISFCNANAVDRNMSTLAVFLGNSAQHFGRAVLTSLPNTTVVNAPHPSAYEYSHSSYAWSSHNCKASDDAATAIGRRVEGDGSNYTCTRHTHEYFRRVQGGTHTIDNVERVLAGATDEEREQIEAAAGALANAASTEDVCSAHDALKAACVTAYWRTARRLAAEAGGGTRRNCDLTEDERAAQQEACRLAAEAGGGRRRNCDLTEDERAAQQEACQLASEAGGGWRRRQDLTEKEQRVQAEQFRASRPNLPRPTGAASATADDEQLIDAVWSFIMRIMNADERPTKVQLGKPISCFQRDRTTERALFAALVRAVDVGVIQMVVGKLALGFLTKYFKAHGFKLGATQGSSTRERQGLLFWALVRIARTMLLFSPVSK